MASLVHRLLVVVLGLSLARAWSIDFFQNDDSDGSTQADLLEKQHKILLLLERIHDKNPDKQGREIGASYVLGENLDRYDDPESVKELIEIVMAGKLLPRHHYFSLFDPEHRRQMILMFKIIKSAKDWDTVYKTALKGRDLANEGMFVYALTMSVLARPDLKGIQLPPLYEINPHYFFPTTTIRQAYRAQMQQEDATIEATFTGTLKNLEQRVAYFGEDIGLNNHHHHWHADFPFWWRDEWGHKDRKGELFFYMHHQLNARFDAERLSNNLPRVEPLGWNKPIHEGFAPHMSYYEEGEFPSRPDDMHFMDIPLATRDQMTRYESRIRNAIDKFKAYGLDGPIYLNTSAGIDILGNMVEANENSPNPTVYGSIHNLFHVFLARIGDPDGRYGLPPGVMEHFETATRDPTFFRLHKYLDDIFKTHKDNLGPYPREELEFPGMTVEDVTVESNGAANELHTFFDYFEVDLNNALDHIEGQDDRQIKARVKRLNHHTFKYSIDVTSDAAHTVTVRVFLVPKRESSGEPLSIDEKRWSAIELDKFVTKVSSGKNTIVRKSSDSSVTIPDPPSFKKLLHDTEEAINGNGDFKIDEDHRHCGLPDRLLIPKGNEHGLDFELWVAVTDHDRDAVEGVDIRDDDHGGSMSYCGILGQKYPDARPMGFPFDRKIVCEDTFLSFSNIHRVDVKIHHLDKHDHDDHDHGDHDHDHGH